MRKPRFIGSRIIAVLGQAEAGTRAPELCRKHGISPATLYKCCSKFGGMDVPMIGRTRRQAWLGRLLTSGHVALHRPVGRLCRRVS